MQETTSILMAFMAWLILPLSGLPDHSIDPMLAWHGRLMVLAWGILIPLGVLAARFFKILPHQDWPRVLDNRVWWNAHRGLQYGGIALSIVGVIIAYRAAPGVDPWRSAHTVLGWLIAVAGVLQVVGGWLRGSTGGPASAVSGMPSAPSSGDHYLMTHRRICFERIHKTLGWLTVIVAMATIILGLWAADAPRWMLAFVLVWWLALAGAFALLQRAGRCIDTYQAIWGPSSTHPGNRRKPIGPGIKRFDSIDPGRPS